MEHKYPRVFVDKYLRVADDDNNLIELKVIG
jgi:hypothetical protein